MYCQNVSVSLLSRMQVSTGMPGNVSVTSVVLVQDDDGRTLLFRQASGFTERSRGASSDSSGKEVHSSVHDTQGIMWGGATPVQFTIAHCGSVKRFWGSRFCVLWAWNFCAILYFLCIAVVSTRKLLSRWRFCLRARKNALEAGSDSDVLHPKFDGPNMRDQKRNALGAMREEQLRRVDSKRG